jgi:outer membrane protein assembly factor BamB
MSPGARVLLVLCGLTGACAKDPDYKSAAGRGGGSGRGNTGTGGGVAGAGGGGGSGDIAGRGGNAAPSDGVLQHHNHASRDGVFVDPLLTKVAAATMQLDPTFAPAYTGAVYAQPLYLDGAAGKPDLVYVATEQNHVLAYDAATGQQAWERALGSQAIRTNTCGVGAYGITGTPIIDGATRVLYVDALTGGDVHKHLVFALDADTGAIRPGWPVDVDATARTGTLAFTSRTQNQRGALALLDGTLFIPYGAFPGDCDDYHGWVVGIATADPTHVIAWATRARGGGVWAPGGISSDGSAIYFATGNTGATSWGDGEGVFKLSPMLEPSTDSTDYFAPVNWLDLDQADADLGVTAPVPIDMPGAPTSQLLALFGKDKNLYLLDRNNLGGVGAPLFASPVLWYAVISAHAVYTTRSGTYIVSRGPEYGCESIAAGAYLFGARIAPTSPPTVTIPWCQTSTVSTGAPSVSMVDADGTDALVWLVDGGGVLYAIDGESGAVVLATPAGTITDVARFQPPIIRKGRVFVAGNSRLYAFKPGSG